MLVSFYILAFNHQDLIGDAIEHALRQTHSPLEILVSDDCSADNTWDVIRNRVSGYRGPHHIKIRRNRANAGIGAHINQVWRECSGNWIVASAGDDYSDPHRVARIVATTTDQPNTKLVQTWLNEVNESGRSLGLNSLGTGLELGRDRVYSLRDRLANASYAPHGAAMAYSRQIVDVFGPLPEDVIFEDNIVNLRAELLGQAVVLADPLVNHRNHAGQVSRLGGVKERATRDARLRARLQSDVSSSAQNLADLERARPWLDEELHARLFHELSMRSRYFERKNRALLDPWPQRLVSLAKILPAGSRVAPLRRDDFTRSLLPTSLYETLLALRTRGKGGQA